LIGVVHRISFEKNEEYRDSSSSTLFYFSLRRAQKLLNNYICLGGDIVF
jgi:hypothetical protein